MTMRIADYRAALERVHEAKSITEARKIAAEALGWVKPQRTSPVEEVRNWIEQRGGPSEIAGRLGMTRHSVHGWQNGRRKPSPALMLALRAIDAGHERYDMTPESLATWMSKHSLDAVEFGRALDVHASTVRRWVNGDQPIPPWLSLALATVETERAAA